MQPRTVKYLKIESRYIITLFKLRMHCFKTTFLNVKLLSKWIGDIIIYIHIYILVLPLIFAFYVTPLQ